MKYVSCDSIQMSIAINYCWQIITEQRFSTLWLGGVMEDIICHYTAVQMDSLK